MSRLRRRGPGSSLHFLPFLFPARLSPVDWPSVKSERHGRCFPKFPLWKCFMSRSLLFLILFGSYHLRFNSPKLLLPGAGGGAHSLAVWSKRDLRRRRDIYRR